MSVDTRVRDTRIDRRARIAGAALFLTNGALFANLVPRFPEIKVAIGIDNAVYGLAVAAFPAGAFLAGLAAAALVRGFGSANVAVVGTVLTGLGSIAAGLAPSTAVFVAGLFFAGAMDAFTDVAMHVHGMRVQRRYGRSIINSFHAVWSVGAILGGSMAAGAIALGLPVGVHLSLSTALFAIVSVTALWFCLPGGEERVERRSDSGTAGVGATGSGAVPGSGPGARTVFMVVALVMIAVIGTGVEDAGNTWAALYLSGPLGAPAALAAAGYVALVAGQFLGRVFGDRLVDRFGQRSVARVGGLVAAVGMGSALLFPTIPGTVFGFCLAGLGVATLVPAALNQADELPGLRPGTGLTVVSWLMRLGFLLCPPLVGFIAEATELRIGLMVVPVAGALVIVLSGALRPGPAAWPRRRNSEGPSRR
ncbi:MFS transporter [Nocardiopsis sp. JB363]|uniref:MFS transporter n=1 Tax=Nocardiopsis sp. JB363 TaxID=1434837 RepID=UPI00097B739C|nr:MFS transporter [Nocardiopsis sp. JB363]SIO85375.1 Membrane protein mosC [Nocardiopsis sp. JB363]